MECKKQVMVTMSAAELRELLEIIRRLIEEDDPEYGFVSYADERWRKLTKALDTAEDK